MAAPKASHSLILADALALLSKTVHTELAAVENEVRVEVARAVAETHEARRERDETLKRLHESQLEEQAWKQEVGAWKAAAEKVEMTSKHQAETILQLRQEARQWKDQCLRLEETARREALDWKEQFLRVEEERRDLLSRIDELVAEKLAYPSQPLIGTTFYTPNPKYPEIGEPSTSTKRASTSSNPFQTNGHKSILPPSPSDWESPSESLQNSTRPSQRSKTSRLKLREGQHDEPILSHVKDSVRTQTQKASAAKIRHAAEDSSRSQQPSSSTRIARQEVRSESRQQVIRRVQATIEIPVKEEELDEESFRGPGSAQPSVSSSVSAEVSPTAEIIHVRKTNKARRSKRSTIPDDDDSYAEEEPDDENRKVGMRVSSSEGDDDELMMGAEDNRKEVYGTHRLNTTPHRPNGTSVVPRSGDSSGKKRKITTGRSSGGSATKMRKL